MNRTAFCQHTLHRCFGSRWKRRLWYVASPEMANFENDLQAKIDNEARFSSSSLYTDLNGERVNVDLHLLNTLTSVFEKSDGSYFRWYWLGSRVGHWRYWRLSRTAWANRSIGARGGHQTIFDTATQILRPYLILGNRQYFATGFPTRQFGMNVRWSCP